MLIDDMEKEKEKGQAFKKNEKVRMQYHWQEKEKIGLFSHTEQLL